MRDHHRAILQHSRHCSDCTPAQNKQNHEECTPHIRMGRAPVVSEAASASRAESAAALVLAVIVEACADHERRAAHHLRQRWSTAVAAKKPAFAVLARRVSCLVCAIAGVRCPFSVPNPHATPHREEEAGWRRGADAAPRVRRRQAAAGGG